MSTPEILSAIAGAVQGNPLWGNVTTAAHYAANEILPVEIPDLGEAINAWYAGLMSHAAMRRIAAMRGVELPPFDINVTRYAMRNAQDVAFLSPDYVNRSTSTWESILRNRMYLPSIDEAGFLYNRKVIDRALYRFIVGRQVNSNPALIDAWEQVNNEIPGPSDLIRFAVREAYNPELIQLFGYHKETPTEVLPWMEKQGYGQSTGIDIPPGGTDSNNNNRMGKASWFDLYWWSHWELPSLTQGYEMLHRLYPDSRFGPNPDTAGGNTFVPAQLELLQKAQDIPDFWRRKLQAISYHPLTRTDAEYMFENNIITREKFYHSLRSGGYNDADAMLLLRRGELKKARNLGIAPEKFAPNKLCELYKNALVTRQFVEDKLREDGYEANIVAAFLEKCMLEVKEETVKDTIKTLEKGFYRGIFDEQGVRDNLAQNGLNADITTHWIQRWVYKRAISFKSISARENIKSFKLGSITEAVLTQRLFNLGYDGSSVTLLVTNAKIDLVKQQTLQLAKQARDIARQKLAAEKELLRLAKAKLKEQKDTAKIITNKDNSRVRKLIKGATDKNLVDWFKNDLIKLDEIYYTLYLKDYSINNAERWVRTKLPDTTKEDRYAATAKAQKSYKGEGHYLE